MSFDNNIESSGSTDDSDIIEQVGLTLSSSKCNVHQPSSEDKDDDPIDIDLPKISASDAIRATQMLTCYFDTAGITDFTTSLQKMTAHIEKDKFRTFRQKAIDDFFTVPSQ